MRIQQYSASSRYVHSPEHECCLEKASSPSSTLKLANYETTNSCGRHDHADSYNSDRQKCNSRNRHKCKRYVFVVADAIAGVDTVEATKKSRLFPPSQQALFVRRRRATRRRKSLATICSQSCYETQEFFNLKNMNILNERSDMEKVSYQHPPILQKDDNEEEQESLPNLAGLLSSLLASAIDKELFASHEYNYGMDQ